MFALLAQRNVFLLWIAHTISILGDYIFFIAITFWVYAQTGSAAATGAVLISSTIPVFLFAPLAAMLVDRWDRRGIMLTAESARAVLFLCLLGIVNRLPHALWPIYIAGFLQTAIAAFFWPARSALLPQLVPSSSLLAANAWYQISDSGVRIIAPALSAAALLHLGPVGVIVLDVASFIISAGCISLLTNLRPTQREVASHPASRPSPVLQVEDQRCVIKGSAKQPRWRVPMNSAIAEVGGLLLLGGLITFTAGTLSILLPIFVRTVLVAGPLTYGWLLTAQAGGEGVVSIFLGRTSPRPNQMKSISVITGGLAMAGISLILIAFLQTLVSGLLLSILFGAMIAAISVHLLTFLQRRVNNDLLGQTLVALAAVQSLTQIAGMGMATIVVGWIGVPYLVALDGVFCLIGSGIVWSRLTRDNFSNMNILDRHKQT
jgi:MFS transporter, DHA3 family, macrolide efflux protein